MCGIIGYTGKNKAVPYLLEGLQKLEYRGYDSAGIALTDKDSIITEKSEGRLTRLKKLLEGKDFSSTVGIGHTRWATHGVPTTKNAHPHLSGKGIFAVVHNGIIENYNELKKELQDKGYIFRSQTDTEVIAHLLESCYNGDPLTALSKTAKRLTGAYALCIVCRDFPDKILCTKKGSPLITGVGSDGAFVASDTLALSSHCSEIYRFDEGNIGVVSKNGAEFFDINLTPLELKSEKISSLSGSADKNGFDHYMLKEIIEQPEAVANTVSQFIKGKRIIFPDFPLSQAELQSLRSIYIVACGSAFNAGLCGKYILESLTGIPTHTDIASEFRYRNPPVDKRDLCIIISQSGETADSIAALKKAKEKGTPLLCVVNVESATIPRLSDYTVYTKAGPEIAVATTKAFSAQLAVMYCLGIFLGALTGKISPHKEAELTNAILTLPKKINLTINRTKPVAEKLSRLLSEKEHAYFIGRGTDYAIATESSLKMKEISYIHSEAYGAGELKHGTISLIEPATVLVSLMCDSGLFRKTYSNAQEVRARQGKIIAVTTESLKSRTDSFDAQIIIPDCHSLTLPSLEVIPMQLLAYYTALRRNCDIDKPRNLAKSVTVE